MKMISILVAVISLSISTVKAPLLFEAMSLDARAQLCGLTVEEFELFSGVVEAESNRDPEDIEGRIYIALTIWNRVESEAFPDTVTEVLTQSGQFSTVRNGHSVTQRTELSDQAVIEAFELNQREDSPEVLFFNCRGFFSWRPAYQQIGGNYFSL